MKFKRCEYCSNEYYTKVCVSCCEHNESDHGVCLDCECEMDPGEAIDRAMDSMEDI